MFFNVIWAGTVRDTEFVFEWSRRSLKSLDEMREDTRRAVTGNKRPSGRAPSPLMNFNLTSTISQQGPSGKSPLEPEGIPLSLNALGWARR